MNPRGIGRGQRRGMMFTCVECNESVARAWVTSDGRRWCASCIRIIIRLVAIQRKP